MCGGVCRCAQAAAGSCSLRSAGCGGGDGDHVTGSPMRPLAVLAGAIDLEPCLETYGSPTMIPQAPTQPVRPPLDHPPRIAG